MLTEERAPRFAHLDLWPTVDAVRAIIEDQAAGLRQALDQSALIAAASEAAAERLRDGGRLVYAGAGTSGRIAVQDGVELHPTFGWSNDRLVFLLAGGLAALTVSVEGAEDDMAAGEAAAADHAISARDVVVCVAASGRTPYTLAVAHAAKRSGALTISVSNNLAQELSTVADYAIDVATGPEVVAGSTRLKAGTAQKAVLNAFSTAAMIRLGYVYDGLMVNMQVTNDKLARRAVSIVAALAATSHSQAAAALRLADRDIKLSIMIARGCALAEAKALLADARGNLREAIARLDRAC